MKRSIKLISTLLAALVLICPFIYGGLAVAADNATDADDPIVLQAKGIIEALLDGEYEQVEAVFSQELTEALKPMGGIGAAMESILESTGALKGYGDAVSYEVQGQQMVAIEVAFENMEMDVIVTFDNQNRVAGLLFQPPVTVEEPVVPDGAIEREVTLDAGTGYPLGGTICAPETAEGRLPAVVLVSGSGQNARDEIMGANRVFAQLAHGLAERGVISLRFDKRTHTYPELWNEPGFTVQQEYMEDVLAAVELLKADERVDASRMFILGHSQGGMLAPRFVEAGADVAGLILLAGSPRNLSDILFDQEMNVLGINKDHISEAYDSELGKMYQAWKAEAEALYAMDDSQARAHEPLYGGAFPAYYMYEMSRYDALSLLKSQMTPALILQGGNDMQVYADVDFEMYRQALANESFVQFKLYPGLNHAFMPSVAADINEAVQEYNVAAQIPAEVLDDISDFINNL